MIEILINLYIGDQYDYENQVKFKSAWNVIHACRNPHYRRFLGYTGRGAPKGHPEYLIARRENRLYLNLVDAIDPKYNLKENLDSAIEFLDFFQKGIFLLQIDDILIGDVRKML